MSPVSFDVAVLFNAPFYQSERDLLVTSEMLLFVASSKNYTQFFKKIITFEYKNWSFYSLFFTAEVSF